MTRRVLVTGGARSGKSAWAEQQLWDREGVTYVATGYPHHDDPEWAERIRLHQERRPSSWQVVETTDVAAVLADGQGPVMVDCLTLWLTRTMDAVNAWTLAADGRPREASDAVIARIDALCDGLRTCAREVFLVSNEVGSGIVPADAGSRLFQDLLGLCNARVAAVCDEVWLCHVGIARRWA